MAALTSTLETLHPSIRDYAQLLMANGFTVYGSSKPATGEFRDVLDFFHYSQPVDGQECYGTYSRNSNRDGFDHTMPLNPSRLNGSSAIVGAQWGDASTLGMDALAVDSVELARIVARPANWCPFNAHPTREAVAASNRQNGTPSRHYRGAFLSNAMPWGIGTHYLPILP